jgi:hypothetical protein
MVRVRVSAWARSRSGAGAFSQRQVLAHPRLVEAEPIGQHELIDVAGVAVGERPVRRV